MFTTPNTNATVARMQKILGLHTWMWNDFKGVGCKIEIGVFTPPKASSLRYPSIHSNLTHVHTIHLYNSIQTISHNLGYHNNCDTMD